MSFVITTVSPHSVVQVSDTRLSSLSDRSVLSEDLRKSVIVNGRESQLVLGWSGLATAGKTHNTADWVFRTLCAINAAERSPDEITGELAQLASIQFGGLSAIDKRCHFLLGGWHRSEPFLGVVSNYSVLDPIETRLSDLKHHIPSFSETAVAAAKFQSWILRFKNLTEHHYVVNAFGDCDHKRLKTHFRGLEGLLKKRAEAAKIGSACRQIVLEAARHSTTIGKNVISVELEHDAQFHCSYYSEQGAEVMLVPDVIGPEGCSTQMTIRAILSEDKATIRLQGKVAKASKA